MSCEFVSKDTDATMATMTSEPVVNHVPVMTGGEGRNEARRFYRSSFIARHAPDAEVVPVARTVGTNRIVEELIYKCTHTAAMPWMRPGVPVRGKCIEVALVVVVQFEEGKISAERIYWDQASVLAQIGLLDPKTLPVTRIEASRKVVEPTKEPSNRLIERAR